MGILDVNADFDGLAGLEGDPTEPLGLQEERALLKELAECRERLAQAMERAPNGAPGQGSSGLVSRRFAEYYTRLADQAPQQAQLGAVYQRYREIRDKLAMANMRLVAHVARRFRDRGVSRSDLLQEGLCGLLEAIDRFDLLHGTKLATYATWWIRQSVQRLVAETSYPVRLSPRHLRQLARNQQKLAGRAAARQPAAPPERAGDEASSEMIERIHNATRPAISLDGSRNRDAGLNLAQTIGDAETDGESDLDRAELVGKLMGGLRPREQQVLSLRFGLGGRPQMSLSQVGRVLNVSKERIRQIQDRALVKLRSTEGAGASAWEGSDA